MSAGPFFVSKTDVGLARPAVVLDMDRMGCYVAEKVQTEHRLFCCLSVQLLGKGQDLVCVYVFCVWLYQHLKRVGPSLPGTILNVWHGAL